MKKKPPVSKQLPMYRGKRSDEWRTPQWLITRLKRGYKFTWDLAATYENAIVDNYYSINDSAFKYDWNRKGVYWVNPPFSYSYYFFRKAARSSGKIVAIYKGTNLETRVWQRWIFPRATWICILKRRLNYVTPEGEQLDGVPFGSILIGFRVPPIKELAKLGTVIHLEASRARLKQIGQNQGIDFTYCAGSKWLKQN